LDITARAMFGIGNEAAVPATTDCFLRDILELQPRI